MVSKISESDIAAFLSKASREETYKIWVLTRMVLPLTEALRWDSRTLRASSYLCMLSNKLCPLG
jgi:hypothetical protein